MIIIDNHNEYNDKLYTVLKNANYNANLIFEDDKRALEYLKNNLTSIVFCDLTFPEKNGVNLTKKIKEINPLCKVFFTSMYTTNYIINKQLLHNIDGYFSMHCSEKKIIEGISSTFLYDKKYIAKGKHIKFVNNDISIKYGLTRREKEITEQILEQKSNDEIAEELLISKRTVETHRKKIMLKFDVKKSIGIAIKVLT